LAKALRLRALLTRTADCYKSIAIPRSKEPTLSGLSIFVIRAVIGLVFAVIITKMFRGTIDPGYVAGLAIILVGLAYGMEYLRHRKKP
jgi:hypothetical protein